MNVIIGPVGPGAQIQQGMNSSQTMQALSPDEQSHLRNLLDEYRHQLSQVSLSPEDQAEAEAEIGTIESQLKSSRPKRAIIFASLQSLRALAERVAPALLTQAIMHHFDAFGL